MVIKIAKFSTIIIALVFVIISVTLYETLPNFQAYKNIEERRDAFVEFLLPTIGKVNEDILYERKKVLEAKSSEEIKDIAEKYGLSNFNIEDKNRLLLRVDIIPPSLVLAQAGIESAWGTSRFATEGNNLFGHRCFEKGCGIIPKERREGENYEVASFKTSLEAVEKYALNLNSHYAYESLRAIRRNEHTNKKMSGMTLADGLEKYSEIGKKYIKRVKSFIKQNDLDKYDLLYYHINQD